MGINLGVLKNSGGLGLRVNFNIDPIVDYNNRHSLVKNNVLVSDPVVENGYANFVGNNHYYTTSGSNITDFRFGTGDFEITTEIRLNSNAPTILVVWDLIRNLSFDDTERMGLYIANGTLQARVYGVGGNELINAGLIPISTTNFTKISVKRLSGVLGLYVDNVLIDSIANNTDFDETVEVRFGGTAAALAGDTQFIGQMKSFTIKKLS